MRGDLIQRLRIAWFRRRWTCAQIEGEPQLRAPAVLAGKGSISFGEQVILGWEQSAGYLSGYTYLEARNLESRIAFGDLTHLNNGVMVVSEGPGISIGRRCLFGPACTYTTPISTHSRPRIAATPRLRWRASRSATTSSSGPTP